MGHKKTIILAIFLACSTITNCGLWYGLQSSEYKDIDHLLSKPQLTKEDLHVLKNYKYKLQKNIKHMEAKESLAWE